MLTTVAGNMTNSQHPQLQGSQSTFLFILTDAELVCEGPAAISLGANPQGGAHKGIFKRLAVHVRGGPGTFRAPRGANPEEVLSKTVLHGRVVGNRRHRPIGRQKEGPPDSFC